MGALHPLVRRGCHRTPTSISISLNKLSVTYLGFSEQLHFFGVIRIPNLLHGEGKMRLDSGIQCGTFKSSTTWASHHLRTTPFDSSHFDKAKVIFWLDANEGKMKCCRTILAQLPPRSKRLRIKSINEHVIFFLFLNMTMWEVGAKFNTTNAYLPRIEKS